jgi:hypothetical protein
MLKEDPSTYCLKLITRFENEFGIDTFVDYISICPYHWFGIYAGSYVTDKNGNNVIYLPHTKDKSLLRETLFHELGHDHWANYKVPQYVLNILNPITSKNYLHYNYRLMKNWDDERPLGMCSAYSLVDKEEEFAELFSFVLSNRNNGLNYQYNGEIINLKSDPILKTKVDRFKRYLKLE